MKLQHMKNALNRRAQKGVTMIEYALIAALIAVAAIAALTFIGNETKSTFSSVGSSMSAARPAAAQ